MKTAKGTYIRPPARFSWWLRKSTYISYMMRELSSLFIGIFSLLMVCGLYQFSQGKEAFTSWTSALWGNYLWLSALMFIFAVYHSYTWFIVTPKAMPLKFSGKRVAGSIIIGAHMLLWLFCSVFVWFIVVNGGLS